MNIEAKDAAEQPRPTANRATRRWLRQLIAAEQRRDRREENRRDRRAS